MYVTKIPAPLTRQVNLPVGRTEFIYSQYLSPLNAFSQNVHILGPNWMGCSCAGIFLIRLKPKLQVGVFWAW